MRGVQWRREPVQTQTGFNDESFNKKPDIKRTTVSPLITAILAVPGTMVGGASARLPPALESKKLVHVNRVDRVSTNADRMRMEWPPATSPEAASLAPALTPGDTPTAPDDFAPPAPEPAVVIAFSRVVVSRPAGDSRFPGRRGLPS